MPRETLVDSRQEILRTAARLFQQRGYDATSMNDVAAALKLSKGGLYHHFQSKDEILFEIMNHAMEITQERVLSPVRGIVDPEDGATQLKVRIWTLGLSEDEDFDYFRAVCQRLSAWRNTLNDGQDELFALNFILQSRCTENA